MADSIPPVVLAGDWLDVYAAAGISVGTPLNIQVIGGVARLAIKATKPSGESGGLFENDEFIQVDGDQSGFWAKAEGGAAQLLIQSRSGIRRMPFSDPRTVDGLKAVTTQPFTEANSKAGTQYEMGVYQAGIVTGGIYDVVFVTGSNRVLIKDVVSQFNSTLMSYQFFKNPDYSGGSMVDVYNLNDEDAVPTEVDIFAGVSIGAGGPGTPISPRVRGIGTQDQGNRPVSSFPPGLGVERVLSANSTYLLRFRNEDTTNTMNLSALATWYQGPLSVELP